jgi:hypothetical protein
VKYGVYGTFLLAAINLTIGLVRFLIVQIGTDNGFMNLPTIGKKEDEAEAYQTDLDNAD